MKYPIKRFLLTPSEAAEKTMILEQIRKKSRDPWASGKKVSLSMPKRKISGSQKKN